jgi:hypothetical protein
MKITPIAVETSQISIGIGEPCEVSSEAAVMGDTARALEAVRSVHQKQNAVMSQQSGGHEQKPPASADEASRSQPAGDLAPNPMW